MPEVPDDAIMGAANIEAGDRVLLVTRWHLPQDQADRLRKRLMDKFPGVEFTIAGDCVAALVQKDAEPVPQEVPC
jgi:hypothetical protein